MSKLQQLHPDLQAVFREAFADWQHQHPDAPQPFVSQAGRTEAEQTALYAQGRQPLAETNRLRLLAGMAPITEKENKLVVTHAKWGQSPHCFSPARAGDVAFLAAKGKGLDWSSALFVRLNTLMMAAAAELDIAVTWGGTWPKAKVDPPHWELTDWRTIK